MSTNFIINITCILIAACAIRYAFSKKTPFVEGNLVQKAVVVAEAAIISKKTDKNGLQHTIVEETNNVLPQNLMVGNVGYDTAFVDSLIKMTDIQKKEIVSLTKVNQSVLANNLRATAVIDSLNRKKFEYTDKNLYLSYTPTTDSTKAGVFDYRFNQELNLIQYTRKKWLFGAERNYMDVSSTSPYSTVNGVRKLTVLRPEKAIGFKASSKSVYLTQTGTIGTGIQLRARFNKLTITGSNRIFHNLRNGFRWWGWSMIYLTIR